MKPKQINEKIKNRYRNEKHEQRWRQQIKGSLNLRNEKIKAKLNIKVRIQLKTNHCGKRLDKE